MLQTDIKFSTSNNSIMYTIEILFIRHVAIAMVALPTTIYC